jgi:Ion transport protein
MTSAIDTTSKSGCDYGNESSDKGGSSHNHEPPRSSQHSSPSTNPTRTQLMNGQHPLQSLKYDSTDDSTPETHIPHDEDEHGEKKDDAETDVDNTTSKTGPNITNVPQQQNLQDHNALESQQVHHRARLLRRRLPGGGEGSQVRVQQQEQQQRQPPESPKYPDSPYSNSNHNKNDNSQRSLVSGASFASETDRGDGMLTSYQSPEVARTAKVRDSATIKGWYTETDNDGNLLHSPNVYVRKNSDKSQSVTKPTDSDDPDGSGDQNSDPSQDDRRRSGGGRRGRGSGAAESNSNSNDDDGDRYDEKRHQDYEDDDDDENDMVHRHGSRLWRARLFIGRLVNHEYVQITIILLIVLNAIMMGLSTMDWVTDNQTVEDVFNKIDRGFLVIFTLEVSMQLFYLGTALFQDAWLIFDLCIVVLSWSFESLQIVRAFRIFRAFRLVTRVKPLRDLVLAVGAVLPRMYAIAALLLIIFYVFAVLFTELFSELVYEGDVNYFKTLDASLFTCMEMMTLEWASIARETIEQVSWAWAPFTAFIAISGFIVYNLIVAVVVEAVAVTEHQVRVMDGMQSDSPAAQLEEAQERIDLIRCHLEDMLRTQNQVQEMIERMAGQLLHLETERMKAEHREILLRNEMNRRAQFQRSMESSRQIAPLERNFLMERERRDSQRRSMRQGSEEIVRSNSSKSLQNDSRPVDSLSNTVHGDNVSRNLGLRDRSRLRRQGSGSASAGGTPNGRRTGTGSNRSIMSKSGSSRSGSSAGSDGASWRGLLAIHPSDKL